MLNQLWHIVYRVYPPFLRLLEKVKIHCQRQQFLVGWLKPEVTLPEIKNILREKGFEDALLAWKDPGEVLSMRKIDREVFQYHLRLFNDGEIRGHYEYSSEGNPWRHIMETVFREEKEYFREVLKGYTHS